MKNNIFLRVKTHRVPTWQGKLLVFLGILIIIGLSWPLIRIGITDYIYRVDELRPTPRIIVENWWGEKKMFENSLAVLRSAGASEVWCIIFEDTYADAGRRQTYILNAQAAGIDTTRFFLIPAPEEDPKTLHFARAVVDTAHQHGWQNLTIVTADLHSARTRKAYRFAAQRYGMTVTVIGVPLEGITFTNWSTSSSGLSMALSQVIKKLYYDFVVF